MRRVTLVMAALAIALAGCSRKLEWQEEVSLQDGRVIQVKRTAKASKEGEIGAPSTVVLRDLTLDFMADVPDRPSPWAGRYHPVLLDQDSKSKDWVIVATFAFCSDWYELGRPKLPYVEYRFRQGRWLQQTLSSEWTGRRANLLSHIGYEVQPRYDLEAKERARRLSLAPDNSEFKVIVSEWKTNC